MTGAALQTYPEGPGYRDPDTSYAAAQTIAPAASHLRAKVLRSLRSRGPMTAFEIAAATGLSFSSIQPRVSELLRDGKVHWTGQKRMSGRSNVMVKVWGLTNAT